MNACVFKGPPWRRRADWMDVDLEAAADQRSFSCSLPPSTVDSLARRRRLGPGRVVEGRSTPRRRLVDLTDLDEQLVVTADDDGRSESSAAPPPRLFLIVEETVHRATSASGHVTCRSVTLVQGFFSL